MIYVFLVVLIALIPYNYKCHSETIFDCRVEIRMSLYDHQITQLPPLRYTSLRFPEPLGCFSQKEKDGICVNRGRMWLFLNLRNIYLNHVFFSKESSQPLYHIYIHILEQQFEKSSTIWSSIFLGVATQTCVYLPPLCMYIYIYIYIHTRIIIIIHICVYQYQPHIIFRMPSGPVFGRSLDIVPKHLGCFTP